MRPSGRRATISVKVPPRSIQNCHFSTSKVSHKRGARSDLDPRRIVYNRPKSRTMLTERVDAVVVGAGVVGLAIARALALAGREVVVLESESTIGTGTSSRPACARFPYRGPGRTRYRRPREPVWHRISGPDRRPGDRRPCTGAASRLTPFF